MRIAILGKGGSGKTTLTSLLSYFVKDYFEKIVFIDADINLNLSDFIKNSFKSDFNLIYKELSKKIKENNKNLYNLKSLPRTLPPQKKGDLFTLDKYINLNLKQIPVLELGTYSDQNMGWSCHHNNLGKLQLFLNHLNDSNDEIIITDFTAGSDIFGVGILNLYDAIFILIEPTKKGVSVFNQIKTLSEHQKLKLIPIANKVLDKSDVKFIEESINEKLFATIYFSNFVRRIDRGEILDRDSLENKNIETIKHIFKYIKTLKRNWNKHHEAIITNHKIVCEKWPKDKFSIDLTTLINKNIKYE
jgi:CO dehydrogenase maturation factor